MKRFVLTPLAEQDLRDIWDYIASDNIHAADRVLKAIQTALRRLAQSPGTGHMREDLADRRHRFLLVFSYLIVYRWQTEPIRVVRILHAARDVQSVINFSMDEI